MSGIKAFQCPNYVFCLIFFAQNLFWVAVLSLYYVLDQPQLRAAGFFIDDPPSITNLGLAIVVSVPVLFPVLKCGWLLKKVMWGKHGNK